MTGTLWKLEPATAAKHRLYRTYLDAWWPIMLQANHTGWSRPRVTYVDAFAGPGEYVDGEEGSPVFVLDRLLTHTARDRMDLRRDRVSLIFIEKDPDRHRHLTELLERRFGPLDQLPVRCEVIQGEAGRDTIAALDRVGAWGHPILAVFDSWGNVNVELDVIGRIADNPSSETITTFGPNWFSRRQSENPEQIDAVFGGRSHWDTADAEHRPDERWRVWLASYRDALLRAGFPYRLQFEVTPRTGQPLYLVYGTGHPSGVNAMKEAMWKVDGTDGMSFRDPRTRGAIAEGQLSFWDLDGVVQPELQELAVQRLREGPLTLEALGEWLLLETSRWRRQHARKVIQALKDDGELVVEPSGRLTKTSVVRLRHC